MHLFTIAVAPTITVPSVATWPISEAPAAWTQIAATVGLAGPAGIPAFETAADWPAIEQAAAAYEQTQLTPWLARLLQAAEADQLATTWDFGDPKDPLPRPLLTQYFKATSVLKAASITVAWLQQRPLIAQPAQEFTRLFEAGADVTAVLPTYRHYEGMTIRELAWQMSIDIEDLELPEALVANDQASLQAATAEFAQRYPGFAFTA